MGIILNLVNVCSPWATRGRPDSTQAKLVVRPRVAGDNLLHFACRHDSRARLICHLDCHLICHLIGPLTYSRIVTVYTLPPATIHLAGRHCTFSLLLFCSILPLPQSPVHYLSIFFGASSHLFTDHRRGNLESRAFRFR